MKICRYWQWRMDRALDDGRALPGPVQRHVNVCPSCRSFWDSRQDLTARLRCGATAIQAVPAASRLPDAVRRAVRLEKPLSSHRRSRAMGWGLPVAVAAVACALLVTALPRHLPRPALPVPDSAVLRDLLELRQRIVLPLTGSGTGLGETIPVWQTLMDRPLNEEWESLHTDIVSAGHFVLEQLRVPTPRTGG